MKTKTEIQKRLATENDAFAIEVLRWVLDGGCLFCDHKKCKEYEIGIRNEEYSPVYLDNKHGWSDGTAMHHMENHIEYNPEEAQHVEELRIQSVDTLDLAYNLFERLTVWMDELEEMKQAQGGITSEWVADVTKLMGQANTSLRMIGQLKKEIGVESQLMLQEARMADMSRLLVEVLRPHPELLDEVELRMAALRAPIIDAEFKESN
tara:strand:+ start:8053 stop:8673 length:621 start_codon:yes stop_codon:yes gene_type:complete